MSIAQDLKKTHARNRPGMPPCLLFVFGAEYLRTFSAFVDVVGGRIIRQALTGGLLIPGTDGSIETTLDGLVTFVTQLLVATLCSVCGDRETLYRKGFRNLHYFCLILKQTGPVVMQLIGLGIEM